jgi:uncharacterized iron-regulated membrane protein
MTVRRLVFVTHKWMGLASSVVLAIAGVTGTLLVWPELLPAASGVGSLHETLALGRPGWYVVLAATAAGIALQASGVVLWWKTRRLRVRTDAGLWRFAFDLHGSAGVIALVVMLVLGATALGRVVTRSVPVPDALASAVSRLHTTRDFPVAVKAVYAVSSLGFFVQGASGLVIWWKPKRASAGAER